VSVARLVEEIQRLFSIKAGEKGVKLLTEIDDKLPRGLLLDEVRLRQVLFNVVGNALKFTEKGQVRIRAWAEMGSAGASPAVFGALAENAHVVSPSPSLEARATLDPVRGAPTGAPEAGARSEEHTSELQSRGHLVC